jgi:hypothetical protein
MLDIMCFTEKHECVNRWRLLASQPLRAEFDEKDETD